MQDPTVRAFRKRLKFHGYAEINILQKKDDHGCVVQGIFTVSATEPLGKVRVVVDYSLAQMRLLFK